MNKCGVAVSVWRTRRDVDLCKHLEVPASLQHGPPSGNIVMCTTAAETSWVAQRVGGLQSSATEKVEDTGRPGSRKTYANDRKSGEAGGVRRKRQEERPAQHALASLFGRTFYLLVISEDLNSRHGRFVRISWTWTTLSLCPGLCRMRRHGAAPRQ